MKNKTKKIETLKAIVYDGYMGVPYMVTAIGSRWWVTTSGEKFLPLEDFMEAEGIGFNYLCEAGGKVGALALAKMLGKSLANPEDAVDVVLRQRVKSLKRLGVTLDVKDKPLTLELEILAHDERSYRQGKYSAICHLHDNYFEMLFDIDAFDSKSDAEEWVGYYFDTLRETGIEFTIIREL